MRHSRGQPAPPFLSLPQQEEGGSTYNRTHHVVVLSVKTQASFNGNRQRLLDYLQSHPHSRLQNIAYATTSRRIRHFIRAAYNVSSVEQLVRNMSRPAIDTPSSGTTAPRGKVVLLLLRQGLRLAGSAQALYRTCNPFRQVISGLEVYGKALALPSFLRVLLDKESEAAAAGPVATQLVIVALEIALARVLRFWGMNPHAVVGHSLGEYAALCVAGVLSVSDTLFLVGRRAELVEELCSPDTHGMLTVAASTDQRRRLAADGPGGATGLRCVECINGPRSTIVSGTRAELNGFQEATNKEHPRTKCVRVATS